MNPTLKSGDLNLPTLKAYFRKLDPEFLQNLGTPVEVEAYLAKLSEKASFLKLAVQSEIVGLCAYYERPSQIFVSHISVLASHRHEGLGRLLLCHLVGKHAKKSIRLRVRRENHIAISFYLKHDFIAVSGDSEEITMVRQGRNYDSEAQDNPSREYRYQFDSVVREKFLKRVEHYWSPGSSCLEIGSHDGSMTQQLLTYFDEVEVIEPSREMADTVAETYGVKVHNVTLEEMPSYEGFKHIFLVHVLEHLGDPVGSLSKLKSAMDEDAKLYILVPNAFALSRVIAKEMGLLNNEKDVMPGESAQGHRLTYDLATLRKHIKASGLAALEEGGIMLKPLSNSQMDKVISGGIINEDYLAALDELSKRDSAGSSSIYTVASRH